MKSANCSPVAPQGNRVSVVMGRATIGRCVPKAVNYRLSPFAGVGWLLGQRPVLAHSFRTGGPIRKVRKGSILLKNSDFRLDHNCRDHAAVTRNFCWGLGLQQRSRPSDLRSLRTGSFKFKGAQTRSEAIFPRDANSGVFQQNRSKVVLRRREQRLRRADSAPTGRFRKDPNGAAAVVPLRARSPTWPTEELPLRGIAAAAAEKGHRISHESGVANVPGRPYRATCCSPPRYRRNGISNS